MAKAKKVKKDNKKRAAAQRAYNKASEVANKAWDTVRNATEATKEAKIRWAECVIRESVMQRAADDASKLCDEAVDELDAFDDVYYEF